jgi:hypothetical protein
MKSKELQNEFLPFPPTGMRDVQKDSLIDIFRMLRPYVMADLKDEDVFCFSAKELKSFALNDSRLLSRCLYALGTGQAPLMKRRKVILIGKHSSMHVFVPVNSWLTLAQRSQDIFNNFLVTNYQLLP